MLKSCTRYSGLYYGLYYIESYFLKRVNKLHIRPTAQLQPNFPCVHCEGELARRMIKQHLNSQTLTGSQPAQNGLCCLGGVDKTCTSVNLSQRDARG